MDKKPSAVLAIFDDDPDDLVLLKRAFEDCRQGIEIHIFKRDKELLDHLGKTGAAGFKPPDLIILGLRLEWENNFELVKKIKSDRNLKHIPLVVLIGSLADTEVRQFYELGVNTVIEWPFIWDELVEVVKKICDYWFGVLGA